MTGLYSTLKIGLITLALMASQPNTTLAENSGRQEKAKTFNELILEKAKERDYKGMENLLDKKTSELSQETKKIESGLEQCIENNQETTAWKCHMDYSGAANELRGKKARVRPLLRLLASGKSRAGDYEGAENTLRQGLSMTSEEEGTYKIGLKYCSVYSQETMQKKCLKAYDITLNIAKGTKANLLYLLGETNEAKQEFDNALRYYRQALEIKPENPAYLRKVREVSEKRKK